MEEFHTPTSGATASNSSEKRQSNRPASSPRLARSTMVRPDSTDADRYTVPTSQGEVTAVSAFRLRGSSPSVAVSQSDCMADIGSSYQAAGFPEEVTNVHLVSWSQSAISQGHLPVGQTKLEDLPVVSRFMKGIFA